MYTFSLSSFHLRWTALILSLRLKRAYAFSGCNSIPSGFILSQGPLSLLFISLLSVTSLLVGGYHHLADRIR